MGAILRQLLSLMLITGLLSGVVFARSAVTRRATELHKAPQIINQNVPPFGSRSPLELFLIPDVGTLASLSLRGFGLPVDILQMGTFSNRNRFFRFPFSAFPWGGYVGTGVGYGYGYPYGGYDGYYPGGGIGYAYSIPYPLRPEARLRPERAQSQSYYAVVNGTLLQYDRSGQLIRQTPLPQRSWPKGGLESQIALSATGGHWSARLTGLQASQYDLGKGFATFWLDQNSHLLHYQVELTNLRNITSVTINLTDPNLPETASPIVAPLYLGKVIPGRFTGTMAGTIKSDDLTGWFSGHRVASLVQAIDERQVIVVVTTAQQPQGALIGAIAPVVREMPEG